MAKRKKKRTKKYSGTDAASTKPTITRMSATSRSPFGQWLYEKRTFLRRLGIATLVLIVLALTVSGVLSLF